MKTNVMRHAAWAALKVALTAALARAQRCPGVVAAINARIAAMPPEPPTS